MKLFMVEAAYCDYDQYDSFVVWAEDSEQAKELAVDKASGRRRNNFDSDETTVTELVVPTEPLIVLGSFNAG